jgi:hypothetical protein
MSKESASRHHHHHHQQDHAREKRLETTAQVSNCPGSIQDV